MDNWLRGPWPSAIGDPDVLGWATCLAYLLAAALCWRARVAGRRTAAAAPRPLGHADAQALRLLGRWWFGLAALLLLLGLNKQADAQSWLTAWGKDLAHAQGWYGVRARVQGAFVGGLAIALAAIALAAVVHLRTVVRRIRAALAGLVLLLLYVALRALLFHVWRQGTGVDVLRTLWPIELAGIALIAWNARRAAQAPGLSSA